MADGNSNEPGTHGDMLSQLGLEGQVAQPQEPAAPAEPQEPQVSQETTEPQEPNAPVEPQEPAAEGEPQPQVFEIINKEFGTDFGDIDSVKSTFESAKRVSDLEKQLTDLEKLKEENLLLREKADPRQWFESEDAFRAAMFKKQFPDKDAGAAYKLLTTDLSTMSDVELIANNILLENPGLEGGFSGAMELVNDQYGIEGGDEPDALTLNKIKVGANAARQNIQSLKSNIQLPDKVDPESLVSQQKELQEQKLAKLSDGWKGIGSELAKNLPDIVVSDKDAEGNETEIFRYSMSKDFPTERLDHMVRQMAAQGIEPSKETASSLMKVMRQEYLESNIDSIIKAVRENEAARFEKNRLEKQNNPGQPASNRPPAGGGDQKGDSAKLLSFLEQGHSKHLKR